MTVKEKIINALTLFWQNIKTKFVHVGNVVDNCASSSTTFPLSANQGMKLQNQIDELNSDMSSIYALNKYSGNPGYIAFDFYTDEQNDKCGIKVIIDGVNAIVIYGDTWTSV